MDVFQYTDYQKLLRDHYAEKRLTQSTFSLRVFARLAGSSSASHLKRVMDGNRNLSLEMAHRYAKAMKLKAHETKYFCDLVRFTHARTHVEKEQTFQTLLKYRGFRRAQHLGIQHAEFLSKWYVPVVREMSMSKGFKRNPSWIASRVVPKITKQQASSALRVLSELGMISDDETMVVQPVISTGPVAPALHASLYHRSMIQLATSALDKLGPEDRNISGVTLRLTDSQFKKLTDMISHFRKEAIGLESSGAPTRVFQLSVLLFPLSKHLGTADE